MTKTVLLAAAGVFALTGAASAGVAHPTAGLSGKHFPKQVVFGGGDPTLYDQNGNSNGGTLTSQNFESTFDAYDDMAADDFKVPKGHTWTVTEVDVTGVYRYTGPGAQTANVAFYKDGKKTKKGLPGKLVAECDSVKTGDKNNTGSFKLKLKGCAPVLTKGTYWVSVQANLDLLAGGAGQWYWATTGAGGGNEGVWQDPGNGWGSSGNGLAQDDCVKWKTASHCFSAAPYEFMFALKGIDS